MKRNELIIHFILLVILSLSSPNLSAKQFMVKGANAMYPVIRKWAEAYMKENPDVEIMVMATGTGRGIKAMIDGKTDIAMSSRFLKDKEIRMAIEKGNYPVPFLIAYDCIIPVVHKNNPVNNLSLDQLKQIFQGEITNWRQVGGKNLKIKIISRDSSAGSFEIFREKVLNNAPFIPSATLKESDKEVASSIPKDISAIGYISLGFLSGEIKAVSIDNIHGSSQNILNGSYPISRPLYLFTKGWPSGEIRKFVDYVLEPTKGQRFFKSVLYEASPHNGLNEKEKLNL